MTLPLSPLSQAFNHSPLYPKDEADIELPYPKIPEFPPGTYITGRSSKEGTFRKRIREELDDEKDPMGPPSLKRQYAVGSYKEETKEESKEEDDSYIPMPGNKDYDKKPVFHRKNVSPFGNYIFNYLLSRVAPPVNAPNHTLIEFRMQMMNDMESLRRLLYDYETHIDYNGCREERLKQYRELDQLLHFNQLETLPQPTGDEICMNPPPATPHPSPSDCFTVSPFETLPDKCDNIFHDHNSK